MLISGGGSNLRALLDAAESPLFPVRVLAVGADNPAEGLSHADFFGVPSFVVSPTNFDSRESWAEMLLENTLFFKPDLVILAGFMRILPSNFVLALSPNLINTHPSLLPNFPGAHAVHDAISAGATETGVTIHLVDEGVDTGPQIAQRSLAILPGESEYELHERIKVIERELLIETVLAIAENKITLKQFTRQ